MQVSVVIVSYHIRDFLRACLMSVFRALDGIDGEVIVVDNASGDGTCEMLAKEFPGVIRICRPENEGFSKANNRGVALAKGKYVLILNPDTIMPEDNLKKALAKAETLPQLGILGVKMIDGTGHFLPESKRNVPSPRVSYGKLFGGRAARKYPYYAVHTDENGSGKVEILTGAYMLVERRKYLECGGFDERYFMYGEDIDLSYTMMQRGYENFYYGGTYILHFKGESTDKNAEYLKRFYGAMRLFYDKHFSTGSWRDVLIRWGIGIRYRMAGWRGATAADTQPPYGDILYVGSENRVFEALQAKYPGSRVGIFAVCSTRVVSRWDDLEKLRQVIDETGAEMLVFDQASNSYGKILFYMQELSGSGLSFRIRPAGAPYFLGSDSSDRRGEVVVFMP